MLACWVEDQNGDYFKKHLARVPDYIWVAEDGIKMQVRACLITPFKICYIENIHTHICLLNHSFFTRK